MSAVRNSVEKVLTDMRQKHTVFNVISFLLTGFFLLSCGDNKTTRNSNNVDTSIAEPIFCLNLVNGLATTKYPSVVALMRQEGNLYSLCSGTFVSDNTLLTAAHCVDDSENGGIFYVPGHYIKYANKDWEQRIAPLKSIHHEGAVLYSEGSQSILLSDSVIDLAILIFPNDTAPSTSPLLKRTLEENEDVTVVGFGKTSTTTPNIGSPIVRRYGQNSAVLDPTETFKQYALLEGLVATIGPSETDFSAVNSCTLSSDTQAAEGDSGGPLFSEDHIAAITSMGHTDVESKQDIAIFVDLNSTESKSLLLRAKEEGSSLE